MPVIEHSITTPYSPIEMFTLVNDVASYKEFVPACADSYVESKPDGLLGTIVLSAGMKKESFTTMNRSKDYQKITMELVTGSFNALAGHWLFESHGERGCKVSIYLDYELPLLYRVMDGYFRSTITTLVEAFQARAKKVYGNDLVSTESVGIHL